MSNPMPNEAMPELLPEHGRNTLNTEQKAKYASVHFQPHKKKKSFCILETLYKVIFNHTPLRFLYYFLPHIRTLFHCHAEEV